ncbi:MAG TPA: FmdE family protein [Acidimicrobiia bacterium]|nr:FmdE family protein [Acidimicrobiia bacterium]
MREFTFDQNTVDDVVAFHGHMCGGIAIGVKASELALRSLGEVTRDEDLIAVVETDMCAVDAIQVITGCSFGKGNLIHRDWGKNAYTFWNRHTGRAVRIAPRAGFWEGNEERQALMGKRRAGTLPPEEAARLDALQEEWTQLLLATPPEQLFTAEDVEAGPPPRVRVHDTVHCDGCGESVAETRTQRLAGRILCAPCFEKEYALV